MIFSPSIPNNRRLQFFISMKYFFFFGHVFLFKDLIITCLGMMAFQKHLSQQFSTGDADKNISPVFYQKCFQ